MSLVSETVMPVLLNALRVVGLDYVNRIRLFRKLDCELTETAANRICAAKFIMLTGSQKV